MSVASIKLPLPYPDTLRVDGRPEMRLHLTGSRDDTAEMHTLVAGNWDYLERFQHLDEADASLRAFEATRAKMIRHIAEGMELEYAVAAHGKLVGHANLTSIGRPAGTARLGYWVGEEFQGHGYAYSAASRVVHFGFEEIGLDKILVRVDRRNGRSERVAEKLGAHLTNKTVSHQKNRHTIRYRIWEIDRV